MRQQALSTVLVIALMAGFGADASADWIVTPYAGFNWGAKVTFNDAALSYDDEFKSRVNFGGGVAWLTGPFAVEFDFGYLPGFFADRKADDDFEFGPSRLLTMMANVGYRPDFRIAG